MKKLSFLLILLMFICIGCGSYCISAEVEKYGVTGKICYDPDKSELSGNIIFVDENGKQITGMSDKDIKDVISIIESGKKLWEFGKNFFGISVIETPQMRLNRILTEYRKYIKAEKNKPVKD